MKKQFKNNNLYILGTLLFLLIGTMILHAQEEKPIAKKIVTLRYFNNNNSTQYLLLTAVTKDSNGISPQRNKSFSLYLDSMEQSSLIAKTATDVNGKAKYFIPHTLKEKWGATAKHTFLAIADEGSDNEQTQETEVTKSKITIDTTNEDGIRNIIATITKLENEEWIPVADVEVKVGVKRLGGILSGGDDPIYTTDSVGTVIVEFKKEALPGDEKGYLILAARVDDNDEIGNLLVEMKANWGVKTIADTTFFDQRTLWTTRLRTPFWLLGIAYSIILAVWGTLIYLVFQLIKIKKLGRVVK